MSLATLIKAIQDIMRKDVGVDGDAQRISQICWLLFLKIFDDKEQEWELTQSNYRSPLQSRFRWSNWAKDPEGMTGEELIDFVNNDLFPSLKQLATKAGVSAQGRVIGSVFEDAYNYMKSGTLLRQVINTIEEDVDFNSSSDRHLFNDIYEKILADLQSAGNAGEYYTCLLYTSMLYERQDRLADLERMLRQVIALDPEHAHAYNALGYTLADHNQRLPEALDLITQALELSPNDPFILDSMGWVKFRMGDQVAAADYLRRAYSVRPEADIAAHLAEVLWTQGKRDQAVELLRAALLKDPKNKTVLEVVKRLGVSL